MVNENNTKSELLQEYKRLTKLASKSKIEISPEIARLGERSKKANLLDGVMKLENLLKEQETEKQDKKTKVPDGQLSLNDIAHSYIENNTDVLNDFLIPKDENKIHTAREAAKPKDIDKEDDDLKLLNQEIRNKISSLDTATQLRKDRYDELITLERELENTVAMINKMRAEAESKKDEHERALLEKKDNECTGLRDQEEQVAQQLGEAERRLKELHDSIEQKKETRDRSRKVEEEQYAYEQSVLQKKEDDNWADDSAKRRSALEEMKAENGKLLSEIEAQEKEVPDLQEKLNRLPTMIDKARADGAERREKELLEEYEHQTLLSQKDAEAAVKVLERKIDSLRKDYELKLEERNIVQEKLDKAYEESNKLYIQTIQSTGGVKILSGMEKK